MLNYPWSYARRDLIAGLTVAAIAVPQAMAYALIAGIDPRFGLYSAIVVTAVASIFGSSAHLMNGPTNAISLVMFSALAFVADQVVRHLLPSTHYTVDVGGHNAALTDSGIRAVEIALGCQNLFDESNLRIHSAVQDSLHAHALLRRDVDYLVKDGAIEMVDEFKGRIALDRRWPAGLHTAVEAKEGVAAKSQGSILGSTTIPFDDVKIALSALGEMGYGGIG